MDQNTQEDWLETRLREEASYIDDAGFTAGVVQRLPARRVRNSLRAVILLGITVIASVIAYILSGGGSFIADEVTQLAEMPLSLIYVCAGAAGLLVMGLGLTAAISKAGSPRLR